MVAAAAAAGMTAGMTAGETEHAEPINPSKKQHRNQIISDSYESTNYLAQVDLGRMGTIQGADACSSTGSNIV